MNTPLFNVRVVYFYGFDTKLLASDFAQAIRRLFGFNQNDECF